MKVVHVKLRDYKFRLEVDGLPAVSFQNVSKVDVQEHAPKYVPGRGAFIISGGSLTKESRKQLEAFVKGQMAHPDRVLVIETEPLEGVPSPEQPWMKCDCGNYWCTWHQMHVHDCICPPIEEWHRSPYCMGKHTHEGENNDGTDP